MPDPRLMEVACAFVVLNDGHEPSPETLVAWSGSREHMAGYKVPRHVQIVPGFEGIGMTASSKIQRKQLREHALALPGLE